jgi:hypothetical protein
MATEAETAAVAALESDAGCQAPRAKKLVEAIAKAAAADALEVVAGTSQAVGGALDRRVAALARVIAALDDAERLPTEFEVGVIFRITPAQGRNVLRTYQARFSQAYRDRLKSRLGNIPVKKKLINDKKVFTFEFDDPALLAYAAEKLRRRGLSRSLSQDATTLTLTVERDERDRLGKDAEQALKA